MKKNRTISSGPRADSARASDAGDRTSRGQPGKGGYSAAGNARKEAMLFGDRKLVLKTGDLSPEEPNTQDSPGDGLSGECFSINPMQVKNEDAPGGDHNVQTVLDVLESVTGLSFSMHPAELIRRHVEKRMEACGVQLTREYAQHLSEQPDELHALAAGFVIGADGISRSRLSLTGLEDRIISLIFKNKLEGSSLRAWIPHCRTGGEAYVVAILLHEYRIAFGMICDVRVIGTDADPDNISIGRRGLFSEAISAELSPERLARYFIKENEFYRVTREIREILSFGVRGTSKNLAPADTDLILLGAGEDSPGKGAQRYRPEILAAGLTPGGFLLVNSRELPDSLDELFLAVNKAHGVYVRRNATPEVIREHSSSGDERVMLVMSPGEEVALLNEELRARNRQIQQELEFTLRCLKSAHEAICAKDIALSELLGQIEQRHQQAVAAIRTQLDKTILPLMTVLDEQTPRESMKLAALLRSSLQQIASPAVDRLETLHSKLSQKDLQICVMIRSGLTSKEIASLLHLSEEAIRSRRKSIRKKLGISTDKVGLDTYLRSL